MELKMALGYGVTIKKKGSEQDLRFDTFHSALQFLSYAMAVSQYWALGEILLIKKIF
jgi:hypothetical protein